METCVRGFSYMAENKVDLVDLQFIEGGELERAWRSNRRERMKQREQKIWDKFVEEQDVVKGVCKDDPYQFLDQLPESCLKEIMENERQKMAKENSVEEIKTKEPPQQGTGNKPSGDDGQHTCVVTFADDNDKDDCDLFQIFDDDQSGPEEEVLNGTLTPETVRDNDKQEEPSTHPPPDRDISLEKTSSKSSENVTHVIESSIYCAKVKDLRMKINEELIALMTTLDRRDILTSEPDDITRMVKRSAEFCGRFNRIYMYQLQRQIHDIKRNNSISLPFAKHTQFQSQMVRIVSLHQNLLQSFQVFHKSVSQTCCVRESASALGSLIACVRDSTHMCLNVPPPKDFTAALDLYKDDLIVTCDKVDEFVAEYAIRCEELLNSFVNVNSNSRKTSKKQMKKRTWNRSTPKNETDARLSMYSLDTLRLNLHAKTTTSRDNQHGIVKNRGAKDTPAGNSSKRGQTQGEKPAERTKSPKRSRRPLMRDPHAGRPKAPKPIRENDIRTMVEAVETCASSHISREASPRTAGTVPSMRRKAGTPRRAALTPRTLTPLGPLTPLRGQSPIRSQSPLRSRSMRAQSPLRPNSPFIPRTPRTPRIPLPLPPHRFMQAHHDGPQYHTPRNTLDPHSFRQRTKPLLSPRTKKRPEDPKTKRIPIITTAKEVTSCTRTDLESVDMMTPVCKIQCAMKKDLELEQTQPSPRREPSSKKSPNKQQVDSNEKKKGSQGFPDTPRMVPELKLHGLPTSTKRDAEDSAKYGECSKTDNAPSPAAQREPLADRKERSKVSTLSPDQCEVTRLLKQLCSGDASRTERVTGAKNAQLVFVNGNNPRQPSTPQLLKILEETIQKKIPNKLFGAPSSARGLDRYRLVFNISEKTADSLFQYRTKFVQHMLTSAMYANSAVGKPWEMIGSISEQIINELLLNITKEMEVHDLVQELYKKETC